MSKKPVLQRIRISRAEQSFNMLINSAYFQSRCRFREGGGGGGSRLQQQLWEGREGGREGGTNRREEKGQLRGEKFVRYSAKCPGIWPSSEEATVGSAEG